VEFGNCGAVLAGYGLWLQELEVGSLVVDAFGDAAIGLLLWLTGVATMVTDGGEGGGQVVDLVDRLDPRRRHAAMHAGGREGALDLPAVRDPARTEGPAQHGAAERPGPRGVSDGMGEVGEIAVPGRGCHGGG
jgi:hypothetical protein